MSVSEMALTELAGAIDQIGIPLILAWFMLRMEKIMNESITSNRDLTVAVVALIEKIDDGRTGT